MVSVWPGDSLRTSLKNVRVAEFQPAPVRYAATVASSSAPETPGMAKTASTALAKTNTLGVRQ